MASEGPVVVALDTTITPELRAEGLAREVISKVQQARKDAGLEVEDRIALGLWAGSEELQQAIAAWQPLIAAETLALRVDILPERGDLAELDAAGEKLAVIVRKLAGNQA